MFVTRRFIILILLGIFPAALSMIPGVGAYALFGYNLLLFIILVVDFSLTPRPEAVKIERVMERKLSLSVWNRIDLAITNPSAYPLKARIRDGIPDSFGTECEVIDAEMAGHEEKTVSYRVRPVKRGEYLFPDLHIRVTGVLGLCVRTKTLPVSDTVKVFPNLKDMRNRHLLMIQKKRLSAGFQRIRQLGIGTEFESIREYTQGDDYRHINWSVTAREGQLYINRYEPERNQYVYILMDTSRVMRDEIKGITRLDYAVNAAFIVAETAMNHGDNIGMMSFDSDIRRLVKPGKGAAHFQRLAESLYNIEMTETAADYEKAFSMLQKAQTRRSLVLLFTDPYNFEHAREITRAWKNYAPRHKVVVLSIKNPLLAAEAEKRAMHREDLFSRSAALKLLDDRKRIFSILEMSGISAMESNPDDFTLEAVNRYISLKSGAAHSLPFQQ
ncbi:MAG: DUF58 domain-containing protein [Clostridiaceae bacterium]|jgi:uncharacterized protein (DUF58 family)|nr:DUF58 domain-containing protein [Clostridiaceae bacterium]